MIKKYAPNNKKELFRFLDNPNINLGEINTSKITDMSELFLNSTRQDFSGIESWNTENVTSMRAMFFGAINFNVNIASWNTKKVLDMQFMFKNAKSFNQPLNRWNVSNVMDMSGMFEGAEKFNQDLSSWDIKSLKYKENIFNDCDIKEEYHIQAKTYTPYTREELEQLIYVAELKNIDTVYISDFSELFANSTLEDFSGIESWNTENVTSMRAMFKNAKAFNIDISVWDTNRVNDMSEMFEGAENFNQNIEALDVSNVKNMQFMFKNAKSFNQPLNRWNVSIVMDMSGMFEGAEKFNQDLSSWETKKVEDMYHMFKNAKSFNQNISKWNLDGINLTNYMFLNASINEEYKPKETLNSSGFLSKIKDFFTNMREQ